MYFCIEVIFGYFYSSAFQSGYLLLWGQSYLIIVLYRHVLHNVTSITNWKSHVCIVQCNFVQFTPNEINILTTLHPVFNHENHQGAFVNWMYMYAPCCFQKIPVCSQLLTIFCTLLPFNFFPCSFFYAPCSFLILLLAPEFFLLLSASF